MIAKNLPPPEVVPALDFGRRRRARVLLLSDTHGFLDPRVGNLAQNCDLAVHAGDVGASTVLEALAAARWGGVAVAGNNDDDARWEGTRSTLRALGEVATVRLPGGLLVAVHGDRHNPASRRHERLRAAYPQARCIVYGHSHRLVCDTGMRPWVLNPGAAGRARTFGGPSCLVLQVTRDDWQVEQLRFAPLTRVRSMATPTSASARQ